MIYTFWLKEPKKLKEIVANLDDKKKYVIHIGNLKTCIKSWINIEKGDRVNKFNQKAWLKPYIDMKTDLRKKYWNKKELFSIMYQNQTIQQNHTIIFFMKIS